MHHAEYGRQINQSVQSSPRLPTKSFHHAVGGSYSQWHHQQKRCHSNENETASAHVGYYAGDVQFPVEPQVRNQVQRAVEERKQSYHSPGFHQRINAEQLSQSRNCQRQEQKDQRQHASRVSRKLKWIGTNFVKVQIPEKQGEWNQRIYKDNDFCKLKVGHHSKVLNQIHSLI